MAVYPFYIEAKATGRKTPIAGGMRKKDGKMITKIKQRDRGDITTPFEVRQYTIETEEGLKLVTTVYHEEVIVAEHVTYY